MMGRSAVTAVEADGHKAICKVMSTGAQWTCGCLRTWAPREAMIAPRDVAGSVGDQGRHSSRDCCVRNEGSVCKYVVYTDSDDV
jgi:hypothetical protein